MRIEDALGDPINGATVKMSSMDSGYPIYPDVVTGPDGFAAMSNMPCVNRSFLFSVDHEGEKYFFQSDDFQYEKGDVLVLRLRKSISE